MGQRLLLGSHLENCTVYVGSAIVTSKSDNRTFRIQMILSVLFRSQMETVKSGKADKYNHLSKKRNVFKRCALRRLVLRHLETVKLTLTSLSCSASNRTVSLSALDPEVSNGRLAVVTGSGACVGRGSDSEVIIGGTATW